MTCLTGASAVSAQEETATQPPGCHADSEPDDSPEQAPSVISTACLAGTLPAGDQDLVVWEVTAADAQGPWTVTIDGVPAARTIADLRPVTSEPGVEPLVVGGPLIVLTVEPDSIEPLVRSDLLLAPGRYLMGISAGGQPEGLPEPDLAYQVTLEPGAALPASADFEPNDDPASASPTEGAFALSGDLADSPDIYRWTVAPDAAAAWTLRAVTQLGASGSLTLATGDSSEILVRAQAADGLVELPDLALAAGEYLLTVDPPAAAPMPYTLSAEATETAQGDAEPNDTAERATSMSGDKPLAKGRLGRHQDEDWYRLGVSDALADGTVDIRMLWAGDVSRELCLYDPDGEQLLCRTSTDGINVAGLSLPAGEHLLRIRGDAAPDDPYLVRMDPAGSVGPDFEREPNDSAAMATAVEPGTPMRARALGADVDHFRVSVSGEPQLWQADAAGTGIESLSWIRPNGEHLASAAVADDGSAASLVDLYLVPGEHWLRVAADDGEYALSLTPLGPPDPNAEREPNDLPAREERLAVGRERVGRLPTSTDTDVYSFAVRGTDHLLLEVEPPPDGEVDVLVMDGIGMSRRFEVTAGKPLRDDLLLGPGDYRVLLSPLVPSQERYTIRLQRLDPFVLVDDQEPNDSMRTARPMPSPGTVSGSATSTSDSDWYALAPSVDGAPLRVIVGGDVTALAVHDGIYEQSLYLEPDGAAYASGPVAPGVPLFLRVSAVGPYTVRLDGAEGGPSAAQPSDLELAISLDDASLAAWWPTGQRLAGTLHLADAGGADHEVTLDALASDRTWRLELPAGLVSLPAGGQVDLPFTVTVPADVPGDEPVRLSVRARSTSGDTASGSIDVEASREALPVEQVRAWPIPDALLGGLDVASLALGAVPITSLDALNEEHLHDGFAATDWGLSWPIGGLPVTLTVDLAGDEPVPVAGTILHPLSEDLSLGDAVRAFELALSLDGGTWETVLDGELVPMAAEQAFVLAEPVEARYAQLRVMSLQRETPSRIDLGEWKVVAAPGWSPAGEPLDLADLRAGGHVVWMQPQPDSAELAAALLDEDATARSVAVDRGALVDWVVGFMDERAALVSSIEWRDPVPSDPGTRLRGVEVWGSTDSPLGPWQWLGSWELRRAADGSVTPFTLESPTWVRFLRLGGATGRKQEMVELPDRIRVLEAPQDETYRSILGQWGMGERGGPLEWGAPPEALAVDEEVGQEDSQERPTELAEADLATGRVHFGEDKDWYLVTVPEGQHTLALTLDGESSVGVALRIRDAGGTEVPMDFGAGNATGSVTYVAGVEPGSSYVVEVSQPQSSVVVSFDSSASVATELAAIESGLRSLSEGMAADREALRIVPFDGEPLLPDWSSDGYEIADAVNRFSLGESSSRVEANLRQAALDLAAREGGRAVLLITDAASSGFDETERLWGALATSRPRIFAVEVGGEGEQPAITRHHLMADWAASAGGQASHARGGLEIGQGFDRLATWLRRPVAYTLAYQTSPEEQPPLPPGRLSVLAPEVEGRRVAVLGGDAVVELVVDTSGSMRKRLGDKTRIDIAKDVLTDLLRDDLPVGAQVALRQFPPASDPCGSVLLTPPGPLDPASAVSTIAGLTAPKDARTPLALAIASVADDLEDVTGRRIVVVVSDGKESCKGDPAAEVKRLRAAGYDVTLNVVGLTLDRKSRKGIARLADLGGGSYFDAGGAESLGAALRAAVSAPVQVLDDSGEVVASGSVGGEPIDVPPGRYSVTVFVDPAFTFRDVYIQPEAEIVLTLPAPEE